MFMNVEAMFTWCQAFDLSSDKDFAVFFLESDLAMNSRSPQGFHDRHGLQGGGFLGDGAGWSVGYGGSRCGFSLGFGGRRNRCWLAASDNQQTRQQERTAQKTQ